MSNNQYTHDPLWTQALLGEAVAILKRHQYANNGYQGALAEISTFIGRQVTANALKDAMARHGLGAPTALLIGGPKARGRRADLPPLEMVSESIERKIEGAAKRIEGRTLYLGERLAEAVASMPPIALTIQPIRPALPRPSSEDECVWFDLSDLQIGSKVDRAANGGLNQHDHAIFLEKLARWEQQACEIVEDRLAHGNVSSIMTALVGDIVDGMGIFAAQPFELDLDGYQQLIEGSRALAAAFVRIRKTFPTVPMRMASVSGNHGRLGRKGESPHRVNFDHIMAQMIKLSMEAAGAAPDEFHIPDAWYALIELFGQTHLLAHGDAVNSSQGVPFAALKTYLLKHSQLFGRPIAWAHHGHWHAEATVATTAGGILVNGNFVGTNAFSSRAMVEGGAPVQMAYGFNRSCGLVWTRKIHLRTRAELVPRLDVRQH